MWPVGHPFTPETAARRVLSAASEPFGARSAVPLPGHPQPLPSPYPPAPLNPHPLKRPPNTVFFKLHLSLSNCLFWNIT